MASGKTISLFIVIIIVIFLQSAVGQNTPTIADSLKADSLITGDSLLAIDSTESVGADSIKSTALSTAKNIFVPDTSIAPYYRSFITGKGYGDYLWYRPGIIPFQHGADGQPEILVKSVLLGGTDIAYNGAPIFQQGYYVPFRSGADLNAFMFENVSKFDLTPPYYLGLFNQGEILSLNGAVWTPSDNPSSITIAGGPYSYKRSGWRFSRRFNENMSGNLVIGFKKSASYYQTGGGYHDFGVSGNFAARPKPNAEITYSFYDHKADQGVIQFDRVIEPFLSLSRQVNYHQITGKYLLDNNRDLSMKLFYQANHNFIINDVRTYKSRIKDYLSGIQTEYRNRLANHHYLLSTGANYQRLGGVDSDKSKMTTFAVAGADSLAFDSLRYLTATARVRYNSQSKIGAAGSAAYSSAMGDNGRATASLGYYDYLPDLYSKYYNITIPHTVSGNTVNNFYSYQSDRDIKAKNAVFLSADYLNLPTENLAYGMTITLERIFDDILQTTAESSFTFKTTPININYNRATITGRIEYPLTKYFAGSSGFSLFVYDPSRPQPGMKHSPTALAFTDGRFQLKDVLRDIDLTAAFQAHYVSAREYSGLVRTSYKQAINLDGSIVIRFGSVEFKIVETNMLDFIGGNSYNIWGEYLMPPGNVWWQLTWNFNN